MKSNQNTAVADQARRALASTLTHAGGSNIFSKEITSCSISRQKSRRYFIGIELFYRQMQAELMETAA